MKPQEYGLEHDEWRPHQLEAIKWAEESKGTLIIEAPTGSGKTALARALCNKRRGVALVRTKNLQQTNYQDSYDFVALFGRGNYACPHPDADYEATAEQCLYDEHRSSQCPVYGSCGYYQRRAQAMASSRAALNYPYWLTTYRMWPAPQLLVCDEAHQLPDITLDWAGIHIGEHQRREWELPMFPILKSSNIKSALIKSEPVEDRALDWLRRSSSIVSAKVQRMEVLSKSDKEAMKKLLDGQRLLSKIDSTIDALNSSPDDWYIVSGPDASTFRGEKIRAFVARPLTAKHHFPSYFMSEEWQLLIMSATIGNPEVFAAELGIQDFNAIAIPSVWSPSRRPIHELDVPRLGQKATDSAWNKQADSIAAAIHSVPEDWHGIIHTTSIAEAPKLAARLARRGLADRVFVPRHASTTSMGLEWEARKQFHKGSLMICWAFWEGYDGLEEKINIAAKVPYPYLGDPYEIQRRNYNGKFFLQRAAWQLEQGLGRTRRGREEDYDTDEESRGLVAIADGAWRQIRNYLSPAFMEAVI